MKEVIVIKVDKEEYRYLRLNLINYLKTNKVQKFEDLIIRLDKFILINGINKNTRNRKLRKIYELREQIINNINNDNKE